MRLQRPVDQRYAATAGSGAFHLKFDFKPTRHDSSMMGQFDLLKTVGRGNFGMIVQVRKKDTQRIYALKSIRMEKITQQPGETTHILAERSVLGLVNNPFIVPLKFALQSSNRLYLVMPFGESCVILSWSILILSSERRGVVQSPPPARG